MKRVTLILLLVLILSALSFSVVSAQYSFASPTNQCGWGVNDGQVRYGRLYVSPGFNLHLWLRFHPNLPFSVLAPLNPGLIDGPQLDCKAIILPSM
jgi:hypothetical protein